MRISASLGEFHDASEEERALVDRGLERTLTNCMRDAGFDYSAPQLPAPPTVDRYGRLDSSIVAVYGYGLPPEYSPEPVQLYTGEESKEFLTAIHGDGAGGCMLFAADQVFGSFAEFSEAQDAISQFGGAAVAKALEDPRYLKKVDDWSACMRTAGYDYSTFGEIIQHYAAPGAEPGQRASVEHVKAAQADLACRELTGVNDFFEQVVGAYQSDMLGQQERTVITQYDALWSVSVDRAESRAAEPVAAVAAD
ncbi:MAG: hypothetical protein ACRDZ2_14690 [Ilumatobacteraceae bacterium]